MDAVPTAARTSATDRAQVIDRLCRIAAKQMDVDRGQLSAATHLTVDLNMDSLELVEFAMSAEDEFGLDLPEAVQAPQTIGQAADAVLAQLAPQPPAPAAHPRSDPMQ